MPSNQQPAPNGKCRAKTKAGRQCAAPAVRGGIYCALHNDPQRAAELGRKGGAKGRKVYDSPDREIPAPQTACDVKNLLAEVMAEIRAGKMDPKLGTTLGYLGTSLLKAIETSEIEERLEKLENGLKNPTQEAGARHD
jgi:general stress protein YciG